MKKEVAELWVEALRSGKYEQGTGRLHYEDKYCCLGVLCKISPFSLNMDSNGFIDGGNLRTQYNVKKWSGLSEYSGNVEGLRFTLTGLNDIGLPYEGVEKLTFNEIADVIQMCWEEL